VPTALQNKVTCSICKMVRTRLASIAALPVPATPFPDPSHETSKFAAEICQHSQAAADAALSRLQRLAARSFVKRPMGLARAWHALASGQLCVGAPCP
jgi:hypothetical protein